MLLRAASLVLILAFAAPSAAVTAPAAFTPAAFAYAEPARAEPGEPVKWYRVRPSFDGEEEYLYEIAERFLGDGDRLDEIFALNRGRPQPDGAQLTVPDEIESGWVLQLPPDADGPGMEYGPLPGGPSASAAPPASAAAPRPAAAPAGGSSRLPILLIAGIVLIVAGGGLGVWLVRRRRTTTPVAGVVVPRQRTGGTTPRAFDAAASWTIDRALRVLVTSAAAAGRPVPPIARVSIDDSWISLRLTEADNAPCEPWEAREGGTVWVAALRALQARPADQDAAAACPRLVTLGVHDGTRELLNLGSVAGPVSVRGEPASTRALLAAWAAELTGSPWSSGVQVVAGGLLPEVADAGAVLSTAALNEAVDRAVGDGTDTAGGWLSVLLLGAVPAGRDADRVKELAAQPGRPWAVVVLGRARAESLVLTLRPDGQLEAPALGVTVQTTLPEVSSGSGAPTPAG
jgi:hypothetical protein